MKRSTPRPLRESEADVIRQALRRASMGVVEVDLVNQLADLMVIAEEDDSIYLVFQEPSGLEYRVADGVGYLHSGARVDVLVWATDEGLSALEIVDWGDTGELPVEVCSWEEAGIREARK